MTKGQKEVWSTDHCDQLWSYEGKRRLERLEGRRVVGGKWSTENGEIWWSGRNMHEQRFTYEEKGMGPNDHKGGKNQWKKIKKVDRVGTEILLFSYNNQGSIDDMIKGWWSMISSVLKKLSELCWAWWYGCLSVNLVNLNCTCIYIHIMKYGLAVC